MSVWQSSNGGVQVPVKIYRVRDEDRFASRAITSDQFRVIESGLRERGFSFEEANHSQVMGLVDTETGHEGTRVEIEYPRVRHPAESLRDLSIQITFHVFFSESGQETACYVRLGQFLLEEYSSDAETVKERPGFHQVSWEGDVMLTRRDFEPEVAPVRDRPPVDDSPASERNFEPEGALE